MEPRIIGLAGLILVFLSFTVKEWKWLYLFNGAGSLLLTIYAILLGDTVFTVLEGGIVLYLARNYYRETRARGEIQ